MELVKNRLASFAISPLNVKGAVLNARLRIKAELVKGRIVQFHPETMTDKGGTHGCTLFLPRFRNSNDLYQ